METSFLPHLNVQTNSNLSFSFLTIPQLVDWAQKNKLNYLAIADYYPYELIDFFKLCREKKIKPIWGVKIFLRVETESQRYPVTVYPHNAKGYKEVLQTLFSPTAPAERVFDWQLTLTNLSQNCSIIFETHRLEEINHLAARWKNLTSLTNKQTQQLDSKEIQQDDYKNWTHEWLINEIKKLKAEIKQLKSNKTLSSSKKQPQLQININNLLIGFDFYLFSPRQSLPSSIIPFLLPFFTIKSLNPNEVELLKLWGGGGFSEAFFTTDIRVNFFYYLSVKELFAECTNESTFYQALLVRWQTFLTKIKLDFTLFKEKESKIKKEKSPLLLEIENRCWQKLLTLKKKEEKKYQAVLEKELAVIQKFDYADYFLIFSEVVDYLKQKNIIVGPGRGSAVSSLVVYLLGITSIDPLQHNLIFERFLNEKRETLPDIDLDVENQEEVFNYLQQKYPKNQVARIIVKKKIGWKKALQKSLSVCREVKSQEAERSLYKKISYLTDKEVDLNHPNLKKIVLSHPLTFALAMKIKDLYYEVGIHPSGVVIAERPLTQWLVPMEKKENFLLSLYEESKLTYLGLKKYDFLSLAESLALPSLDFIKEWKDILKIKLPSYHEISYQDEKTHQLLGNFLLTGVFQLDTPAARQLFLSFHPKTLAELTVFLALNRPGMRQKIAKEIVKKKNQLTEVSLATPWLKQILAESYGFIIFEEQISQIFTFIYNCSFAEAEIKRRELTQKGLSKDFFQTAGKKLTPAESKMIYQQINSIIGYSFNKAHAVAYGCLTYYLAYLKANFFSELIPYFLNKNKEKTLSYLQEAFFYGFQIEGPDINYSEIIWVKRDKKIIMGFSHLKEYQSEFFQSLIEERNRGGPFLSWENLFNRTISHWENLKITAFEEWIKSNLFKSLQVEIDLLLNNKENVWRYLQIRKKIQELKPSEEVPKKASTEFQTLPKFLPFLDLSNQKTLTNELIVNQREWESLGLYVSHFSRCKKISQNSEFKIGSLLDICSKIEEYNNQETSINIYAVICQLEKKETDGCALFLQEARGSFKLKIIEPIYQMNKDKLVIHNELLFGLKVVVKEGRIFSLTCDKIESL